MDSKTETLLVIILLEVIVGFLFSFFIIIFLSVIGFQKKNMMTYVKILIPLNVSNISFTFFLASNFIIGFLWPELLTKTYLIHTLSYMTMYSITSSLWLSAVLCVFYFMKIVPSQPRVLTTLKRRIDAVVLWLIIMAEVVSLGEGFLSMLISNISTNQRNSSITMSEFIDKINAQSVNVFLIVLLLNFLPFLVIIMTTIGSAGLLSLYNHQIQKNMTTTSGNTRVRDYGAAIQTMIGLLVFYVLLLLCMSLSMLNVFSYLDIGYWLCVIFLFSNTTILPALLIYGNPGLKEAIKQMITR
ncbi:taste receptor type 2 member 40-like [Hyla sarda]|uniref:taste receptor type 2 member 40-like n=1 Tax=Hyla sarda TaxID=327740 RepID=UPI0024C35937|nr:taste receptor type 2 member 40-like [Hyla sarda]